MGILAQPTAKGDHLYIAASYVKWLEAGGARSIAIQDDLTDDVELDELFQQIHGLFIPGGATDEMSYAIQYLLNKAVESNQEGHYFPVWGTCMGFEYLVRFIGGDDILQAGYQAENKSLPLEGVVRTSFLYSDDDIYQTVISRNTTLNNHHLGLHPATYWSSPSLQSVWEITSINHDETGRPFVSTLEPISDLPFYGVQYHPEKNAFEYATYPHTTLPYEAIDHSPEGVAFSTALARVAVHLARTTLERNDRHAYTDPDRFPYVYTYPQQVGTAFEQIYIIPKSGQSEVTRKSYLRNGDMSHIPKRSYYHIQ
jgi:gamma-glutamyl hydrolase